MKIPLQFCNKIFALHSDNEKDKSPIFKEKKNQFRKNVPREGEINQFQICRHFFALDLSFQPFNKELASGSRDLCFCFCHEITQKNDFPFFWSRISHLHARLSAPKNIDLGLSWILLRHYVSTFLYSPACSFTWAWGFFREGNCRWLNNHACLNCPVKNQRAGFWHFVSLHYTTYFIQGECNFLFNFSTRELESVSMGKLNQKSGAKT